MEIVIKLEVKATTRIIKSVVARPDLVVGLQGIFVTARVTMRSHDATKMYQSQFVSTAFDKTTNQARGDGCGGGPTRWMQSTGKLDVTSWSERLIVRSKT